MPKQPTASPAIEPDRYRADRALPEGGWGANSGIRLTELADRLAERGLRLGLSPPHGDRRREQAEIGRLMAATGGSVGLLLDIPGIWPLPAPTRPIIAWRHGPRISHVHCKDVRPGVLAFLDAVL